MTRMSFFLPFPLSILLFPHFSESDVGSPGAFYLQMMLPKFGNTVRGQYGEYGLLHCPFSAFDVGWSVWSRRGQVGEAGSALKDCMHSQDRKPRQPIPFSPLSWEVFYEFSNSSIRMSTKQQGSVENIKDI